MTLRNNSGPVKWILIILVILFLAVFLILPLVYILMTALGKGVEVYKASITDKYAVKAIDEFISPRSAVVQIGSAASNRAANKEEAKKTPPNTITQETTRADLSLSWWLALWPSGFGVVLPRCSSIRR